MRCKHPCGYRVLVTLKDPFLAKKMSSSGLILAAETKEQQHDIGVVLGIGTNIEIKDFEVGDTVALTRYSSKELYKDKDGFPVCLVNDDDILAVLEE